MGQPADQEPVMDHEITRSTRDHDELRERLQQWLNTEVQGASISELEVPDNGMSSETVLFSATWDADGPPQHTELVARLAAADDAVPAFPDYDLTAQAKVMELVRRTTNTPVPEVRWVVTDTAPIGCEFFVMDREHGEVPPDVMPYPIESFLLDANAEDRRRLQDASVDVVAEIHRAPLEPSPDAEGSTAFLEFDEPGETTLRRHFNHWVNYEQWVCAGRDIELVGRARRWLEDNWPTRADKRDPVLSWGDARIGNIMYRDFTPVAVFDWELAGIGPRELDLAWMSFLHTFFQDITVDLGLPGMPEFMRAEDVAARYTQSSGVEPVDLEWFLVYTAYRHAAIMVRMFDRQIHFGLAEPQAGGEAAILHRDTLAAMID